MKPYDMQRPSPEKTKHAPEPWSLIAKRAEDLRIRSASMTIAVIPADYVSEKLEEIVSAEGRANARRIVACVNACAGIPTEELEARSVPRMIDDAVGQALLEQESK